MPIEFLDLLDDSGWQPIHPDIGDAAAAWSEGGTLADAPVDAGATYDGAAWRATGIDESFGLTGVRLGAGFAAPVRHHDDALLVLVFAGELTVGFGESCDQPDESGTVVLGAGQFCVIEPDTPHSLRAGADGATFLWSWPQDASTPGTCWHPGQQWKVS